MLQSKKWFCSIFQTGFIVEYLRYILTTCVKFRGESGSAFRLRAV
jgi:hypothetical protein